MAGPPAVLAVGAGVRSLFSPDAPQGDGVAIWTSHDPAPLPREGLDMGAGGNLLGLPFDTAAREHAAPGRLRAPRRRVAPRA